MSADSFAWFQIGINSATGEIRILPVGGIAMQNGNGATVSFTDRVAQYLEHGRQQGGKGGRPWNAKHARMQADHLALWVKALNVATVDGIKLEAVEAYLAAMRAETKIDKRTKKEKPRYSSASVWHRFTALKSFVHWCHRREYISKDPLRAAIAPSTDPEKIRRPLSIDELTRLLRTAPPHRALVYEVAVDTGLRLGALQALTVGHLSVDKCGLRLEPQWSKNKKEGFKPLSPDLCEKLAQRCVDKKPTEKLLKIGSSPIHEFDRDLKKAGIEKVLPEGVLDFHALKATGVTYLEQIARASDTEVRAFGDHQTARASRRYRTANAEELRARKAVVRQHLLDALHGSDKFGVAEGTRIPDLLSHSQTSNFTKAVVLFALELASDQQIRSFLTLSEGIIRVRLQDAVRRLKR